MKALIARLNTQLFQTRSQDHQLSSVGGPGESDDEDIFSRAFQQQVTLGMCFHKLIFITYLTTYQDEGINAAPVVSLPPSSVPAPRVGQPATPPFIPNMLAPSPPVDPEPMTVPDDEVTVPLMKRTSTRVKKTRTRK